MLFFIAGFIGQRDLNSRFCLVYQYSATMYEAINFYLS